MARMLEDAALTALALEARGGDRRAASELAHATYPQVWRMLVVLSDRHVAEDLAQETFVRVFRSLPGFRAESTVRAWVLSIARRVAADHLRSVRTRPRTEPPAEQAEERWAAPDDVAESVVLRDLLAQLDPDRRMAFVLTQVLGLGYAEAAQVCGCPVGTIRSRVARARDDLAAHLTGRPDVMAPDGGPGTGPRAGRNGRSARGSR
jgi:RNA polymerase sigma-70 factor, ECF subfamily